ncbi:hypothetical protein ACHAWF_006483, partial [Thalassiosira exigua]
MHDCWGDHAMSCVANNKTMAHNYMRDGFAVALQAPLATAGFILSTTKLEKERTGLIGSNPDLKPLDMSFRPEPAAEQAQAIECPHTHVG